MALENNPISEGQMRQDLAPAKTSSTTAAAEGSGLDALFKVCSVQRVDTKNMTVDLITLTGGNIPYKAVSLTFASAGARTFCGVLPQPNDNCVIGFAPKESGRTRQPYIVGWLIPGTAAGYDWVPEQPGSPLEQPGTQAMQDRLEGLFTKRRHKLHNFAPGNGVMSSAQGADLVLDESATLVNRRGNELVLRDQDQALVVRSLQQFHAGAGFRIYGGMVQRDASLLPTQMINDGTHWASYAQLEEDGTPAGWEDLGESDLNSLNPATIFQRDPDTGEPLHDQIVSQDLNPYDVLPRGLFITSEGTLFDRLVTPDAVYGGKPIFRVSQDAGNSNTNRPNAILGDVPTFTEYRIEVAHTSDGTLPVTEQTDGVDIDRLPDSVPTTGNAANVAAASPFVEFVLGTVVGNDPTGERTQYGVPLKAQIFENGVYNPKIVAARDTPEEEQLAVLLRVKNPSNLESPPAFWGITKGGALKSYFPGHGSETAQEHYQTGKTVHCGSTGSGDAFTVEAQGCVSLLNDGGARAADNVGVELSTQTGALNLYGGASQSNGNSAPPSDSDAAAAQSQDPAPAVKIASAVDTLIEAPNGQTFIRSPKIFLDNASSITESASSVFDMSSGDAMNLSANTMNTTVNGKAVVTYGGPKDALPTSGPLRETQFTGNPATGCLGGAVDEQSIVYGGRQESQTLGKRSILCKVGGIQLESMSPGNPADVGPGTGTQITTGAPFVNNGFESTLTSATMSSVIPGASVSVSALAGQATVHGSVTTTVRSAAKVGLQAPYVGVTVPGAPGGVLTDGCIDSLTGMPFLASGTIGTPTFRVGA